jgi:hypothetical protein
LQRRLDQGEAKLSFQEPHGYLLSVLQQLNVPLSSQTLVFRAFAKKFGTDVSHCR